MTGLRRSDNSHQIGDYYQVSPIEPDYHAPATFYHSREASRNSLHERREKHAVHTAHNGTSADDIAPKDPRSMFASHEPQRRPPTLLRLWWAELTAIFVSAAAFFAILGIIYQYRELRAAPQWRWSINVNTIIAILGVVLRASLVVALAEALSQQKWLWFGRANKRLLDMAVFDQAARGSWGSFKFFFTLSGFDPVASLGALLIILSIAIDPFTQQLVGFTPCALPSNDTVPTIPRRAYISYNLRDTDLSTKTLPFAFQNAIYSPEVNSISVNCPSGQCRFDEPYYSLGYCSKCEDISEQLKVDLLPDHTIPEAPRAGSFDLWNFSLPSGAVLQNMTNNEYVQGGVNVNLKTFPTGLTNWINTSPNASNLNEFVTSSHQIITIANKLDGCSDQQKADPKLSWRCRGYGAAQCSLKPCVQKLSMAVTNGTVSESILSSSSDWGLTGNLSSVNYMLQMLQVSCLTEDQKASLRQERYNVTDATEWLPYNSSLVNTDSYWQNLTDTRFPNCFYSISSTVPDDVRQGLNIVLTGNTTLNSLTSQVGDNGEQAYKIWQTSLAQRKMYNSSYTSFDYIESLYRNMSKGLSIGLREGEATEADRAIPKDLLASLNKPQDGTLLETTQCIIVYWPWLIYPAVLIVFSTIFVLMTILDTSLHTPKELDDALLLQPNKQHSRWRPAASWKSSLLPLMFHGLEDGSLRSRDRTRLLNTAEMEREVRRMQVKLAPTTDGWKLVHDHEHQV